VSEDFKLCEMRIDFHAHAVAPGEDFQGVGEAAEIAGMKKAVEPRGNVIQWIARAILRNRIKSGYGKEERDDEFQHGL